MADRTRSERAGADDTHPDAERVQLALLRGATIARRVELARSLSQTCMQLARRAIRRADPDASEEAVDLRFVALRYGQPLADGLRAHLQARRARRE